MPVVGAQGRRKHHVGAFAVVGGIRQHRPTRLQIHVGSPGDPRELVGGQELTGRSVENIKETVLRRLHQHRARLAVPLDIRQNHVLGGRIVPTVAGGGLIVPGETTRIRVDGQDG